MRRPTPLALFLTAVLLGIAAVTTLAILRLRPQEIVEEPFQPRESHDSYRSALTALEVADSEMGSRWLAAADRVESAAIAVAPPVTEVITFDPRDPSAVGYRFPVSRGRQITISIAAEHRRYFADVFRLGEDGTNSGSAGWELEELVASRPDDGDRIVFEARGNAYYLLRVQPELLRGGRFTIEISESASLAFPVEGTGPGDIWSFFGDGRDGGVRVHHGIDIFAPRGTPVLAASDAEVIRVGRRDRGGNVVVLRDGARDILLYYAHLDEQLVETGARVRPGDIIGTVGNTGNAITTFTSPSHRHLPGRMAAPRRPLALLRRATGRRCGSGARFPGGSPDGKVADLRRNGLTLGYDPRRSRGGTWRCPQPQPLPPRCRRHLRRRRGGAGRADPAPGAAGNGHRSGGAPADPRRSRRAPAGPVGHRR